jgi:hypothetical protein
LVTERPPHQLLDQIGLPGERVHVVARLVGEPEAEEVERERRRVGFGQEGAPIERARREAVEQDEGRAGAGAVVDVNRMAGDRLGVTLRAPALDPVGELRSHRADLIPRS